MCNGLNLLSWGGWSVISSFSCLVPHGVCKPWQDSEESGKLESAGIWNHSWSATVCDMRDYSNVFACLQDLFLTGAADELLLQPSLWAWDQPSASPGCQMTEEGGFAHTHKDSWYSCEWAAGTSSSAEGMAECSHFLSPWDQEHEKQKLPSLPLSWHINSTASSGLRTTLNCQEKCYSWDWKCIASLESFMWPKFCSDWFK